MLHLRDLGPVLHCLSGQSGAVIALPVTHDMEFLSPGHFDVARHSKAAGANHARYSKRANVRSSAPQLLPYLGSANGANFDPLRCVSSHVEF
jgi:hypothetical protein